MKRTTITSILGVVISLGTVASSYSQGSIWFDNYNNLNPNGPNSGYSSPIYTWLYTTDPIPIPSSFAVDLYYVLGVASDPYAYDPLAMPIGRLALSRGVITPGYVSAAIAVIPDYVSGPITFELVAHGNISGMDRYGHSQVLTLPSIATGTTLPGYLDGLQSFTAVWVPEPTTFSLVTMGSAMLLMFRRRNA